MLSRIVKKIVWIWFCDTQLKTTLICERKRRQQITSTILKASSAINRKKNKEFTSFSNPSGSQ